MGGEKKLLVGSAFRLVNSSLYLSFSSTVNICPTAESPKSPPPRRPPSRKSMAISFLLIYILLHLLFLLLLLLLVRCISGVCVEKYDVIETRRAVHQFFIISTIYPLPILRSALHSTPLHLTPSGVSATCASANSIAAKPSFFFMQQRTKTKAREIHSTPHHLTGAAQLSSLPVLRWPPGREREGERTKRPATGECPVSVIRRLPTTERALSCRSV